jgi:hypothetical protein
VESFQRFADTWTKIAASSLVPDVQVRFANVAWALAGFERSYDLLTENFHRTEEAMRNGVPPVMAFLSGPHEESLQLLLGASLWLDLGEVIAHYRTVADRFAHLKGATRRGLIPAEAATVEGELHWLRSQSLPALANAPVTKLADRVLHEAWHPAGSTEMSFPLYFRESGRVDLAEADLRQELQALARRPWGA